MVGARWKTASGLQIGDSAARLKRLYPRARIGNWDPHVPGLPSGTTRWLLRPYISQIGDGSGEASTLVAHVKGGRVVAFEADVGAGGE
jgi:hypothetical protein